MILLAFKGVGGSAWGQDAAEWPTDRRGDERVDSETPLAWDLLWLGAFGVLPMAIGWGVARRASAHGGGPGLVVLELLTVEAGGWALRPVEAPYTVAAFGPGRAPERIAAELETLGAPAVWAGPSLDLVLLDLAPSGGGRSVRARLGW